MTVYNDQDERDTSEPNSGPYPGRIDVVKTLRQGDRELLLQYGSLRHAEMEKKACLTEL